MFRAPCPHRQEVKIVLYSLWYHHIYMWPSRALSQPVRIHLAISYSNVDTCTAALHVNRGLLPLVIISTVLGRPKHVAG